MTDTEVNWRELGEAAILRAVDLTAERDRARAIAVALEQRLAAVADVAAVIAHEGSGPSRRRSFTDSRAATAHAALLRRALDPEEQS